MKKTNQSIDLAKFLASVLIFAMHCKALSDYNFGNAFLQLTARWGVPFFFLCSAYFLFSKSTDGNIRKDAIYAYIKRIGALYAVWFVYNIPSIIYKRIWSSDLASIDTWLVFLKNSVLSSTFKGSWYLASSMFSAWFVFTLSKKISTKAIIGLSSVFYILCVFTSAYLGLLPPNVFKVLKFFCFPLNIFNGCLYFALGKYIAENIDDIIKRCGRKQSLIAFIISYLLFLSEIALARHFKYYGGTDVAFSTVLMSVPLCLYCLQVKISINNSVLLRNVSTIIYCSQGNVLLVNAFCKRILKVPSVLAFLISSVITAAICAIILYIQKNRRWSWARYLT